MKTIRQHVERLALRVTPDSSQSYPLADLARSLGKAQLVALARDPKARARIFEAVTGAETASDLPAEARALLDGALAPVADRPIEALDPAQREHVLELLAELNVTLRARASRPESSRRTPAGVGRPSDRRAGEDEAIRLISGRAATRPTPSPTHLREAPTQVAPAQGGHGRDPAARAREDEAVRKILGKASVRPASNHRK